ncbi:MAG: hypothetical protein HPY82_25025 [Gammaproteobacteria bacterium]|nr:hypothetical protein [Gammaproteobacteria bacterium]
MRLFLDIDGVILDLDKEFENFTNAFLKKEFRRKRIGSLTISDWQKIWINFLDDNSSGHLTPKFDVQKFNTLTRKSEVILLTAFPESCRAKRVKNLSNIGLIYDELHFHNKTVDQYKADIISRIATKEECFIFMDDLKCECDQVKDQFTNALVYLSKNDYVDHDEDVSVYELIDVLEEHSA